MSLELSSSNWERVLTSLAHEAVGSHRTEGVSFNASPDDLDRAYRHCSVVTRQHSQSFSLASALLSPSKRRAVRALYSFCRTTDDIVDRANGKALEQLQEWRHRSLAWPVAPTDPVVLAWTDTRTRYHVPRRYAEQLIDGVARDLVQTRYQTFDELAGYCYGVASTVGLMSMFIVGFESDAAIPYAVKLGVALQLTNILRDVGEDWRLGRLYLPQQELAAFGLSEKDVERGQVDYRWRRFMGFQITRVRRLYEEAWPGIELLAPEGRLAIAAAAGFYREILKDIEDHDYDVFSRRAHVGGWGKIRLLPGLWWQMMVRPAVGRGSSTGCCSAVDN